MRPLTATNPDIGACRILTMNRRLSAVLAVVFAAIMGSVAICPSDARPSDARRCDRRPITHEVYTMRANGSRQVNRTQHPAFDIQPDWQALPGRHH
jgi:hypothetical protein